MRNALYADVAPLFVAADGVIRVPAGHGRVAWVARADVARLAVGLLTESGHEGREPLALLARSLDGLRKGREPLARLARSLDALRGPRPSRRNGGCAIHSGLSV